MKKEWQKPSLEVLDVKMTMDDAVTTAGFHWPPDPPKGS